MPRGRALPGAVGALCRALPPRARLVPEALRRAKLDRPQATLDFWRLLYALLKQIHGGKWTESDAIDTQIRFVKSALWYHGYGRPELYRLPSDGSAGSRELLLAFSWLLHRMSLLEQLLARNRVRTGDETSVCMCEDDLSQSEQGTTEIAPEYGPEDRVDVRYLQWLNGRLRFQWRSLHAQHQEQCKLLHKIHLLTSGSHVDQILGHFSVTEMDLIRQPESYKQLVQLLELETMQLEAFLEWKQLEPVYWQWMETVLDNMAEEGNMCQPQDTHVEKCRLPKVTSCCPWADSLTGQISKLSRDLKALRDQLHELVTHRKSAWEEKMKTRAEDLQKEDLAATVRKIQEAVELKLLDLSNLCAPKKNKMHGLCRLVYRSKHSASRIGFSRSVSKEPAPAVSATEVIRELQMREASLQRELEQLREECRQRMDKIAEGLDGVICISP
ncbi:tubulin epsilon and delta complex protein 1 isoform X1 [Oxyura jamaicensis]|uniref:tubulin epsilon and delta complex protein 1 isoform X1 n=1 Tax=Oxyura jamaicensis TaxID=8884 RepID=UPI0015A53CAF|nr:tubulin epsilon and delta complex protein 1 isoform X1 [Oxyura jamaicensis]